MIFVRVKWRGERGGWTARLFTNPKSARTWAESRLDLGREVIVQLAESEFGWNDPIDVEDLG